MEFKKDDVTEEKTASKHDTKKMISLRLNQEIIDLIESMTEMYNISQSKLISTLIFAHVNEWTKEETEKQLVFHKAIN